MSPTRLTESRVQHRTSDHLLRRLELQHDGLTRAQSAGVAIVCAILAIVALVRL